MSKVRCVHSSQLDVTKPDGKIYREVFSFGEIHNANVIEILPDGYINIELANGNRIYGVNNRVFENMGTPTVILEGEIETQINDIVDAPCNEQTTETLMMEGVVLTEDDDFMDDDFDDEIFG